MNKWTEDQLDRLAGAYRQRYGRSGYVAAMVTDDAAETTLRLVPR